MCVFVCVVCDVWVHVCLCVCLCVCFCVCVCLCFVCVCVCVCVCKDVILSLFRNYLDIQVGYGRCLRRLIWHVNLRSCMHIKWVCSFKALHQTLVRVYI